MFLRIVDNWFSGITAISPYDQATAYTTCPDRTGFMVGELNGVVISSFLRVPWGDNLLFGSLLYVEEKHRGSRFGKKLAAFNQKYMIENNKKASIDSVKETPEMYQALGMKITSLCTVRYHGVAQKHQQENLHDGFIVKVLNIKTFNMSLKHQKIL